MEAGMGEEDMIAIVKQIGDWEKQSISSFFSFFLWVGGNASVPQSN
jgi:hypothetical protein